MVGLARTLANELGRAGDPGQHRASRCSRDHDGAQRDDVASSCDQISSSPTVDDAAAVLTARNLLPVPWVEPVDVANAVVFLASDEARYITGTQLVVDAGLTEKAT